MKKITDYFTKKPFIVSSKPYYEKIIAENEARIKKIEKEKEQEGRVVKRNRLKVIK